MGLDDCLGAALLLAAAVAAISAVAAILLANLRLYRRDLAYEARDLPAPGDARLLRVLEGTVAMRWIDGNRVELLVDGDESFPAMFDAVRSAQRSITFENYVYWSGEIGRRFAELLAERARAGVSVHVLLDWFGSLSMDRASLRLMRESGVEVRRYHHPRLHSLHRLNHRTHRRELVVDGRIGFTGGVGFADEWDERGGEGAHARGRRDNHYRVEGPVVGRMQSVFLDNWLATSQGILHDERYFPELPRVGSCRAALVGSKPDEKATRARLLLLLLLNAARKSLLVEQPYFVPDAQVSKALIDAARRGVRVEILLPGDAIDHPYVRSASRTRWGPLLQAGVRIHEYQDAMLHAKMVLVDGEILLAGSLNIDYRSLYRCDETVLVVPDQDLVAEHRRVFERDRDRSVEIGYDDWRGRPQRQKCLDRLAWVFHSQL